MEKIGYKVSVSHSVSMQGSILEQLIRQGVIKGFLDLCPFDKMYDNPEGRKAFLEVMKSHLKPAIELCILDCHINDNEYTEKVMELALRLFNGISRDSITKIVNLTPFRAQSERLQDVYESSTSRLAVRVSRS